MSNVVFPFTLTRLAEAESIPSEGHQAENFLNFARDLASLPQLRVEGIAQFGPDTPNANAEHVIMAAAKTAKDFRDFWIARGMSDTFFYFPAHAEFGQVLTEAALQSDHTTTAGNATGAADELFYTSAKYVSHTDWSESASSLLVYSGGVLQTITTDYTVSGNGTAPVITTTANFDAGAVTFSYSFYRVVRFRSQLAPTFPGGPSVDTLGTPVVKEIPVVLIEDKPGGYLVPAS
jgi:hypothetical protein